VINRQGGAGDAWVAQSSHADHMILEGRYIPDVIGGHTDGVLMVAWGAMDDAHCVQSGMIGTDLWDRSGQELLKGVGEVTVTASDTGDYMDLALGMDRDT